MNSTATLRPGCGSLLSGALLLATLGLAPPTAAQNRPNVPPAAALPQAAPTGPWTLQQAVEYAVQNNLQVRQSQLSANLNEATLRQSRLSQLPVVNGSASQTWNYGTNVDPFTFQFQNVTTRANNFSLNGQITLFSGFQVRNTIKRNSLDYEAAVLDIEQARNDLSLNVASAYLQLLLGEELARTNELRINSAQQQIERTQKLLRAGSVAESNLLDAQAQLATDELNLVTAQNQRDLARVQLVQLLNLEAARVNDFTVVVPNVPEPEELPALDTDMAATYQTAQATQPQIKAAELRVQSAMRGVEVARGAYYPRLTFGGGIFTGYSSARSSRVFTGDSTVIQIPVVRVPATGGTPQPTDLRVLQFQPRFSTSETKFIDQLQDNVGKQLSFNLNIPILNGWQARTNVQRSVIGVKQAQLRADQTRLQLQQNIQQAYADALAAQRRYQSNKRQVEALGLAYRNAEIRFNNGLLNGTDFNIAKNNLSAAESGMIQAKYEYLFRRKVLDFYQGKPLSI